MEAILKFSLLLIKLMLLKLSVFFVLKLNVCVFHPPKNFQNIPRRNNTGIEDITIFLALKNISLAPRKVRRLISYV